MELFRRFFFKKAPDRLLEISERVYVFDSCLSRNAMEENEYKVYLDGIVAQLQVYYPVASFMVFNFREGEQQSQISHVLSQYDMTVMDYPRHYANCPLLPLEMIHHFLRSSESWLSQQGQQDVLLMHCDTTSWPVLAFMLSGLLLHRKQYQGEQKTLDMVYKQAPMELLRISSPLNPHASQLRYLQYISRRNLGSASETPLLLDCLILRDLPCFEGRTCCRPVLRVYGQDPKAKANKSSMLLFSTPKTNKHARLYQQEECILVKLNIGCRVQGDVVLECIHLHDDLVREEIVFRIMFHTAFLRANILMVHLDEMDILWDAKDQFPKEFKAEVLFSGADAIVPTITTTTVSKGESEADIMSPEEFFEVEEIFSDVIDGPDHMRDSDSFVVDDDYEATSVLHSSQAGASRPSPLLATYSLGHSQISQFPSLLPPPEKGRANNTPGMLKELKMPLPDMMAALLAIDDTILDIDQIENLIKFCPTEEEMELLENYTGDKTTLGKYEQLLLGLMKVPQVESKLRVFSHKIQFGSQITEFKTSLNAVNSACEEVRTSQKLKEIMKKILYLGNTLNQGTVRGAAVGFKLDSLLKLSDTSADNSKMTLMHYLCKVLASKASALLDFPKDLKSLESASKIQLKSLAEEMQDIIKGLEKLNQELTASESDGPVSDVFRKTLKDFISIAETEVATVSSLYAIVENNANQLAYYFAEDPCPFEQVTATLLNFIRLFKKAHEENIKQAELENNKKATEEGHMGAQPSPPSPMYRAPPPPPPSPMCVRAPLPPPPMYRASPPPPPPPMCVGAPLPPPPPPPLVRRGAPQSPPPLPPPIRGGIPPPPNPAMCIGAPPSPPGGIRYKISQHPLPPLKPLHWDKVTSPLQGSLWYELQRHGESQTSSEFDVSEIETLFSAIVPKPVDKDRGRRKPVGAKPEKVQLIDLRRANNTEIMLTKVKMPLPDMMAAVLAMDDTVLDIDQIENLIKFCPTKEEMERLKNYIGDKTTLGKCEQYFLELMTVPQVESKLTVFSFKIRFGTQITELKKSLNAINSACEEVRTSQRLKEIMKKILDLGNTLNRGTTKGAAVGFKLESLLKLSDTRAANSKMTLMHYLCKVLASKASVLLDFHKDLASLESVSKIQLKSLAEEMQYIIKGLEKLKQELTASESDGPVSDVFRKTLKDFISIAKTEVATVSSLYAVVGNNADQLAFYFGEDPKRCPFEKVVATLLNFIRLFKKAHEENIKQAELEKKKATKEGEMGAQPPPPAPNGAGRGTGLPRPGLGSLAQKKTSLKQLHWVKLTRASEGSLLDELQRHGEAQTAPELDISEIEALFSALVEKPSHGRRNGIPQPPPPSRIPYDKKFATPLPPLPPSPPPPPMSVGSPPSRPRPCGTNVHYGKRFVTPQSLLPPQLPPPPSGGPPLPPPMGAQPPPPAPPPPPPGPMSAGRGCGLPCPCMGSPAQEKPFLKPFHWLKVTRALQGSLWDELQKHEEAQTAPELDISEIEALFYA